MVNLGPGFTTLPPCGGVPKAVFWGMWGWLLGGFCRGVPSSGGRACRSPLGGAGGMRLSSLFVFAPIVASVVAVFGLFWF